MAHAVVEVGAGAGDGAVGEGGQMPPYLHILSAKCISSVGKANGPHGIADQHDAVRKQVKGCPDGAVVIVDAVSDQFHRTLRRIQGGSDGTGIPMAKIRHGVAQMAGAGGKGLPSGVIVAGSVSEGDDGLSGNFPDTFHGAGQIGGDGNQTDSAVADFIASVEKFRIRQPEAIFPVGAFFDRIEKRSFHVDACDAGTLFSTGCSGGNVFPRHIRGNFRCGGKNFCQRLLRQCHGGGTVGGNAVGIFVGENFLQPLDIAVGEIPSDSPVAVNVHQAGKQQHPLCIQLPKIACGCTGSAGTEIVIRGIGNMAGTAVNASLAPQSFPIFLREDASSSGKDVSFYKGLIFRKDEGVSDAHHTIPPVVLLSEHPVPEAETDRKVCCGSGRRQWEETVPCQQLLPDE